MLSTTYRIEPIRVHCLLATRALGYQDGPLASVLTSGVFPLRFYALLEQVEVCPRCYPAWRLDVVV